MRLYEKYARIRRNVVRVEVCKKDKTSLEYQPFKVGSGFLLKSCHGWLVVTAFHVVRECVGNGSGGTLVRVHWTKSRKDVKTFRTSIVRHDENADIAVLRIEYPDEQFSSVKLWSGMRPGKWKRVGVRLLVVSYPFVIASSELDIPDPVLQTALVSGVERRGRSYRYVVDCLTTGGSSGGPVFRERTLDVVGIVRSHLLAERSEVEPTDDEKPVHEHSGLGVVVPIPQWVSELI